MIRQAKAIVRQVLSEATDAPQFFDQSDAQRLNWMIGRAFELGKQQRSKKGLSATKRRRQGRRQRKPQRAVISILVKAH
jgi:hypothetical protein